MLFRDVRAARRRPQPLLKKPSFRPVLELLEDRWLLSYTLTGQHRTDDVEQALRVSYGKAMVSPNTGDAQLLHALDFDVSPGTEVGGNPALVYHSSSVDVRPVIEATLTTEPADPVPSQILVRLTWNSGTPQSWVTFSTSGHATGDTYLLAARVTSAVTASGLYPWQLDVKATVNGSDIERTASGVAQVVVRDSSPYGAGWFLSGLDQLLPVSAGGGGVLWLYGSGGSRFFASAGGGTFTSSANDVGSLVQNGDGSYTYTAKHQDRTDFGSDGGITRRVDTHNVALTYTFSAGKLSTVRSPDGAITTLTYQTSPVPKVTITEPVQAAELATSNGFLSSISEWGGSRGLSYSDSRLAVDTWSPLQLSYFYSGSSGGLSSSYGGESVGPLNLTAALGRGLATSPAASASLQGVALWVDALNQSTTYTLDVLGRELQRKTPDGAVQSWQRDAAGQITSYTDPLNRITTNVYSYGSGKGDLLQVQYPDQSLYTFTCDSTFHRLTQFQDSLNRYSTYVLDAQTGDVLSIRNALNQVTTQTWSQGLLQSVTDARGNRTSYLYDAQRRLQVQIDANQGRTTYSYATWTGGYAVVVQDALAHTVTTVYDPRGQVVERTNALGHGVNYTYTPSDFVNTTLDPNNIETEYSYSVAGLLRPRIHAVGTAPWATSPQYGLWTTRTHAVGTGVEVTIERTHDALGRLVSESDGRGNLTSFTYDPMGRRRTQINPDGGVETWTYDLAGQRIAYTNALGNRTSYTFNSRSWETEVIDAQQNRVTTVFDSEGNKVATVDPNGNRTTTVFDALNRPIQATDAIGNISTVVYDAAGNAVVAVDARGNRTTTTYDSLNRPIAVTDPLLHTVTQVFDAVGNAIRTVDPTGATTTRVYDAANRLISVQEPGLGIVTTVYDNNDNVINVIDQMQNRTTFVFDQLNRRTQTIDARGGITTVVYDAANNITQIGDSVGNSTTYIYATVNRKSEETDALGRTSSFAYDVAGRLTSTTDRLGRRREFVYDSVDRLLTETWKSSTGTIVNILTYTYDAASNRLTAADQNGLFTMTYDALHRTSRVQQPFGVSLTYTYDGNSNRTRVQDSFGAVETSTYDAANRLTNRETANSGQASIRIDLSYNARNQLTGLTRNQGPAPIQQVGTSSYTYDSAGRLTNLEHRNASGTLLANDTMTYDLASRLTGQTTYGQATVTVKRSGGSTGAATVNYATSNGSATSGQDYASTSGTLSFADGELSKTFTIPMLDDASNEGDETINLTLSNASGAALGTPSTAVLTLVEDDNTSAGNLQFSASTYSVDENAGTATITVRRSGGSTGTVTVNYATSDNTATAGQDYTSTSGTLTFVAGELTKTITIPILQDGLQEGNETVDLTLSNAGGGASLGTPSTAVLTIVDPDTNPTGPRFDFGTATSPVASGYTRVKDTTAYSSTLGYGWEDTGPIHSLDRETGNDLKRDLNYVVSQGIFLVDVSNGTYQVGLTLGDSGFSYDQMGIYLEGVQVDNISLSTGQFVTPLYTVTVSDGQLTLKLKDLGGSTSLVVINALRIFTAPAPSVEFSAANVYVSESGRTLATYTYDAVNELTADGTSSYSYDLNGNRTMSGYQTGTGNRLTSDGVWAYTYDNEGNLTKKSKGAQAETWTYTYDHRNHMTTAVKRASDGGTVQMSATYMYDVFGHRTEKSVDPDGAGAQGTTSTRFAYDGQEVWADLNSSNALQTRYLHGHAVDQIFARLAANGTAAWYLTDRQGSVRDVADASGAVLDHTEYDGFGNILSESNPSFGDRYKWTGRELDSETGLQYNRARYYDPKTGRWTSEDPKGFDAGDSNLYRYVFNNPARFTDPLGEAVYWATRDIESGTFGIGNHHLILVIPDNPEDFKDDELIEFAEGIRGFILSAIDSNGVLRAVKNHPTDVEAVRERYKPFSIGDLFIPDYDLQTALITPSTRGKDGNTITDTQFIRNLVELAKNYEENTKKYPVPYRAIDVNCATWVNSMFYMSGISKDVRDGAGDQGGWDFGAKNVLHPYFFDSPASSRRPPRILLPYEPVRRPGGGKGRGGYLGPK